MGLTQDEYEDLINNTKRTGKTYEEWADDQSGTLSTLKKSHGRRKERAEDVNKKMDYAKLDEAEKKKAWQNFENARGMDGDGKAQKAGDYEWMKDIDPERRGEILGANYEKHFLRIYTIDDKAMIGDVIMQVKKNKTGVSKEMWAEIEGPYGKLHDADMDYYPAVLRTLKTLEAANFVLAELKGSYNDYKDIDPADEDGQKKSQQWYSRIGEHLKRLGKTYSVLSESVAYVEESLGAMISKGAKEYALFCVEANAEHYSKYGKDLVKDKSSLTFASSLRAADEISALRAEYANASDGYEAAKTALGAYAKIDMTGTEAEIKLKPGARFSDPKVMEAWQNYTKAKQRYDKADRMLYPDGNRGKDSDGVYRKGEFGGRLYGQLDGGTVIKKVKKTEPEPPPRMLA